MTLKSGAKNIVKYLYWKAYGKTLNNPPIPHSVTSLLFVCQGNICRSPFAEKIAVKNHGQGNKCSFRSAGIRADASNFPPVEAVAAAETFGVDLRSHKTRPVDSDLLGSTDMVVSMEAWHHKYLLETYPEFSGRLFLLPLFDVKMDNPWDQYSIYNIRDPYGKELAVFMECFRRIERCIGELARAVDSNDAERKREIR